MIVKKEDMESRKEMIQKSELREQIKEINQLTRNEDTGTGKLT